ncbi:MAG: 5'/3'-nucleotidase SurE [Novosphingobium sp.]|nr:5'/3'-nucleotidase SurE [Novosphingobium sp.]
MHLRLLLAALLSLLPQPALALNIVLTNDDGLTSNVKALYDALKAEGHDVVVSVPCVNQSGMGAAIKFLEPLTPLTSACRNGAARVGDPGAGPMTKPGFSSDFYYVNGTPVMAALYGIDVPAVARWGKAPDLLLSGPNEGQNVGFIVISSGTVSNAQYGAIRGIPSVALSAGVDTVDNVNLSNPKSAKIAQLTVRLIGWLRSMAGASALLPPGMALNVNFPDVLDGANWRSSRIGDYSKYKVRFTEHLPLPPGARDLRGCGCSYPGVTIEANPEPNSEKQSQDESVVYRSDIAVTAMQVGYDHRPAGQDWLRSRIKRLTTAEGTVRAIWRRAEGAGNRR